MARKRPLVNSQYTAPPEGFEYAPRSPELAPTKDEKGKWHFPIKAPKGSEVSTTAEWQWADAAVESVQALLQNDAPALKHCLAEDAKSHIEVARAKEEAFRAVAEAAALVARFLETPPEQHPELVTQIQGQLVQIQGRLAQIGQSNSWGTVNQHDVQDRVEAIIRCLAPHAETGAKAKTYRGKLTGSKYGAKSVQVRQDKKQPRDEQIYQEFIQAGLTTRKDIAAKKDALARKYNLKWRRSVTRIITKQAQKHAIRET